MNCSEAVHLFHEEVPEAGALINCGDCVDSKSSHMQEKNEKRIVYWIVLECGTWSLATTGCCCQPCGLPTKSLVICTPS